MLSDLGCTGGGLPCLRAQKVADILRHQKSATSALEGMLSGFSGVLVWAPVIDGRIVPSQPNAARIRKPTIIGTNLNEGEIFVVPEQMSWLGGKKEIPRLLYETELKVMFPAPVARRILAMNRYKAHGGDNTDVLARMMTDYLFTCANRHVMARASGPVYGYLFSQRTSYSIWPGIAVCAPKTGNVCHTFELPYVFGNPTTITIPQKPKVIRFTPAEQALSRTMGGYWTGFAATLNPNRRGSPNWPGFRAGNPVRQVLDTPISRKATYSANCRFWDSVGYNVPGLLKRLTGDCPKRRKADRGKLRAPPLGASGRRCRQGIVGPGMFRIAPLHLGFHLGIATTPETLQILGYLQRPPRRRQ